MDIMNYLANPSLFLNKVSYKALPILEVGAKNVDLTDSFEYKYLKEKRILAVYFKRNANVNPVQLFEMEIEYVIYWETNDIDIEEKLANIDDKERSFLCYTAPSESSLLIGNLTKSGGMPPLITPNEFLSE